MARPAVQITLSPSERQLLLENTRPNMQYRIVQRAKVILLAADGLSNEEISKRTDMSFVSVSKWRNRYARHGIVGLKDASGRGRKRRLTHDDILKVVEVACTTPATTTQWSVRRLAAQVGFVKKSRVHTLLKSLDLKPHQSRYWCFSNDPDFEKKKVEIVGLYLRPPKNAFVVCIDEKPCIQATSRIIRPMRQGSPEQRSHEYTRHGTVDLFAAFRVHDGKVIGKVEGRHRGVEFLAFVKLVYKRWGQKGRDLHIVLDNLATHDVAEVKEWLQQRGNVTFHFTPTHASWLNQIELWFAIIQEQTIKRGNFYSRDDLAKKILAFIDDYNRKAKPFAWTHGDPLKA